MLDKSIDAIRINVLDDIKDIYVIAPNTERIVDFCKSKNVNYINEVELVGYTKNDFNIGSWGRNGWLYQQLIKLNGDRIVTTDNYATIDADHVLLKPHQFYKDGVYHFYMTNDNHKPYAYVIDRLFNGNIKKTLAKSFIADKIIFSKDVLKSMKEDIEKYSNGKSWDKSIIEKYYKESGSGFSEFETYGTYFYNKNKDKENFILKESLTYLCKDRGIENKSLSQLIEEYDNFNSITLLK